MAKIIEFFKWFSSETVKFFTDIPQRYSNMEQSHKLGYGFRAILILVSILAFVFVLRKIRKKQLHIDDALFWIISSASLMLLSIFPQIAYFFTVLLGMSSPVNFVFLVVIFVILIKLFTLAIDLSVQKQRLNSLVQNLALANEEIRENKKKLKEKATDKKSDDASEEISDK